MCKYLKKSRSEYVSNRRIGVNIKVLKWNDKFTKTFYLHLHCSFSNLLLFNSIYFLFLVWMDNDAVLLT